MSYIKSQGNQNSISKAAPTPVGLAVGNTGLNPIGRIAAWSAAHRWWVILAFVLTFVLSIFVMSAVETKTLDYNGEGESAEGAQLIDDGFEFNLETDRHGPCYNGRSLSHGGKEAQHHRVRRPHHPGP